MSDDDRELERLFLASRRLDEGDAPPFSSLVGSKPKLAPPVRPIRAALPATLSLLVVTAGLVLLWPRHSPRTPPPTVGPIGEWEAPTDFLLRTPGYELLGPAPPLQDPIPRLENIERPKETKGTAR